MYLLATKCEAGQLDHFGAWLQFRFMDHAVNGVYGITDCLAVGAFSQHGDFFEPNTFLVGELHAEWLDGDHT